MCAGGWGVRGKGVAGGVLVLAAVSSAGDIHVLLQEES